MQTITGRIRHISIVTLLIGELVLAVGAAAPAGAAETFERASDITIAWVREAFDQADLPFRTQMVGEDLLITYEDLTVAMRISSEQSLFVGTVFPTAPAMSREQAVMLTECLAGGSDDIHYLLNTEGQLLVGTEVEGSRLTSHLEVLQVYGAFVTSIVHRFQACQHVIG